MPVTCKRNLLSLVLLLLLLLVLLLLLLLLLVLSSSSSHGMLSGLCSANAEWRRW
jgi:hypothetical protein